jgi:hypothetical protein
MKSRFPASLERKKSLEKYGLMLDIQHRLGLRGNLSL